MLPREHTSKSTGSKGSSGQMVPCQGFIRLSGRNRQVKVSSIRASFLTKFAVTDRLHDDICVDEACFFCIADQEAGIAEFADDPGDALSGIEDGLHGCILKDRL